MTIVKRRPLRVLLVVACVVVLAATATSCTPITGLIHTQHALENAGYRSVSIRLPSGGDHNALGVSVSVDGLPSAATAGNVASVVWQTFPARFDPLNVTVHGNGPTVHETYSHDQLEQMFGARPDHLDQTSLSDSIVRLGVAVLVGFAVVAGVVVLIVVLVVRRNRRTGSGRGRPPQPGVPWGSPYPPDPYRQPVPGWGSQPGPGPYTQPSPGPGWASQPSPGPYSQPGTPVATTSPPPAWPPPADPPRPGEQAPGTAGGQAPGTPGGQAPGTPGGDAG